MSVILNLMEIVLSRQFAFDFIPPAGGNLVGMAFHSLDAKLAFLEGDWLHL